MWLFVWAFIFESQTLRKFTHTHTRQENKLFSFWRNETFQVVLELQWLRLNWRGEKTTASGEGNREWRTNISAPRQRLDEASCWGLKLVASRQFPPFCRCPVKQVKTHWDLMTWKRRSTERLQFTGLLFRGALSRVVRGSLGSAWSQTATITRLREPGQTAGRSSGEPEHLGLRGLSRSAPLAVNQQRLSRKKEGTTMSWTRTLIPPHSWLP